MSRFDQEPSLMPSHYLAYDLSDGAIDNWLVAGPLAMPVPDLQRCGGEDHKPEIARHDYLSTPGIVGTPGENRPLVLDPEGDAQGLTWRYDRCLEDHLVDLSGFYHTCHYLRAWAYAQVRLPVAQRVTLIVTTNGPADVWLNGEHIQRWEHFQHQIPQAVSFPATLRSGRNELLVRFEAVAMRECPYTMSLRLDGLDAGKARVLLPTPISAVARRQDLERVFERATLDRDVYARDDQLIVRWPDDIPGGNTVTLRAQTPSGSIYCEARPMVQPAMTFDLIGAVQLPDGPLHLRLMPPPPDFYEGEMRIERRLNLHVLKNAYSQAPYGTYEERRLEALVNAARREAGLYSEIAKMELGWWDRLEPEAIQQAIEGINQRRDCSDLDLVGLLGMAHRYMADPAFPAALKQPLEQAILDFRYWMDEPGEDAMCFWSENHQILFHTCEVLAGQLFPERVFANARQTGQWQREKGERMALAWLSKRAGGGWREWDSNCYFEEDILALSHLADLAENVELRELAAVVLDKLLFSMALNSYRGVFGSTHGRTYAPFIKGARLEPTAGISRLLWGMGVFNERIRGVVGLVCAKDYELPSLIADIAADLPDELWSRERHAGELEPECDRATGSWEVNKVSYKTPDYMLSSAQDYHPGEPGGQQHIWQATLGPDAVVFVTQPPCMSEDGAHRPNFWHGNHTLPRVAQWRDVLVALHKLPSDAPLGFTHAYFPTPAFDEYTLRDGWAFARKEDGYLALTASRGLSLVTQGQSAYRELRSYGPTNVWLCQMGRAARDGAFADFQQRVLALQVTFDDLAVRCRTLRDETLAFAWEGSLQVDGSEVALSGYKHYESLYCTTDLEAPQMDIRFGEWVLRLNLSR